MGDEDLLARIDRLEALAERARWVSAAQCAGILALGALLIIGTRSTSASRNALRELQGELLSGFVGATHQVSAKDRLDVDSIRTRSIEVVDEQGSVRAQLSTLKNGGVGFSLIDDAGKDRALILVSKRNGVSLTLLDEAGHERAELSASRTGTSGLYLIDEAGNRRVELSRFGEEASAGGEHLRFFDCEQRSEGTASSDHELVSISCFAGASSLSLKSRGNKSWASVDAAEVSSSFQLFGAFKSGPEFDYWDECLKLGGAKFTKADGSTETLPNNAITFFKGRQVVKRLP